MDNNELLSSSSHNYHSKLDLAGVNGCVCSLEMILMIRLAIIIIRRKIDEKRDFGREGSDAMPSLLIWRRVINSNDVVNVNGEKTRRNDANDSTELARNHCNGQNDEFFAFF